MTRQSVLAKVFSPQAQGLFELVYQASITERQVLLERECGSDIHLRQEVETLLRAFDAAGSFLTDKASPPLPMTHLGNPQMFDSSITTNQTLSAGIILGGKYLLKRKIGEGGMGEVWEAEQKHPLKRAVAIKLVRVGLNSRNILTRFEAERQALALMDHPNIAKVLDAGTTETGHPFYVMDLIQGVSLTSYCDTLRLPLYTRLDLFRQVCLAVQHAHQKGILHRDLKPSNILVEEVDNRPVPKVIDFGLVKVLTPDLDIDSINSTSMGMVLGTPEYMAPEQARLGARDVDTRSDIYALGIILYELLTGSTPHRSERLKDMDIEEMLRIIREEEPLPPSARLAENGISTEIFVNRKSDTKTLRNTVKGDLDWIVMKCLAKDRDRRYSTSLELADDLSRYLCNEPVLAGPPGTSYRIRKFVRRNRGAVIAAGIVFLTLLGGIIGTTYGLIVAREAQHQESIRAEKERIAKELADKHHEDLENSLEAILSPILGDYLLTQKELSLEQKQFLKEVLPLYRKLMQEKDTDEQSRERIARAAGRVSRIEYLLGHLKESLVTTQQALQEYLALKADFPEVIRYHREVGEVQHSLGLYLHDMGRLKEAEVAYLSALEHKQELVAEFPTIADYQRNLAMTHLNLGVHYGQVGQFPKAIKHTRSALEIQKKLVAEYPKAPDYQYLLVNCLLNLTGRLQDSGGQATESEKEDLCRSALEYARKLAQEYPSVPEYALILSKAHTNLMLHLNIRGPIAKAEEHQRSGIEILRKLVADYPTRPKYRYFLAVNLHYLGEALRIQGHLSESIKQLQEACSILMKLVSELPEELSYRFELARSHRALGITFAFRGEHTSAIEQYQSALTIQRKLAMDFPKVPKYRSDHAQIKASLGWSFHKLDRFPEACSQYQSAMEISEKVAGEFSAASVYRHLLAQNYSNFGVVFYDRKKWVEAEEQYQKAITIQEKLAAEFPLVIEYQYLLGVSYINLAHAYREQGKLAEFLLWLEKAIPILDSVYTKDPRRSLIPELLWKNYRTRAGVYDQLKKYDQALKDWDRTIELSAKETVPSIRAQRAFTLMRAGKVNDALTEVTELTKAPKWSAAQWYDFGCIYALASTKDSTNPDQYANRATELLQKAVDGGWKDANHMAKDSDLESLRDREDFKKLIASLTQKK